MRPTPTERIEAELDSSAEEMAHLTAELAWLAGARRWRASFLVTFAGAVALLAAATIALCIVAVSP
jgi:hypothetical protein